MVDSRTEAKEEADRLVEAAEKAIGEDKVNDIITEDKYDDMVDRALTSSQEEFRKQVGEKLYDPVLIQLIFEELTEEEQNTVANLEEKFAGGSLFAGLTGRAAREDDPRRAMSSEEFIEHMKKKFGLTDEQEHMLDKLKVIYEAKKTEVPEELRESPRVE